MIQTDKCTDRWMDDRQWVMTSALLAVMSGDAKPQNAKAHLSAHCHKYELNIKLDVEFKPPMMTTITTTEK